MRFCSLTLGCKVNQYETQGIGSILISRGHTPAKPGDGCDVCIINTCAVTAESVRKSRQAVRRLKKLEPGALIAVCGCLSQLDPQAAVTLGADLVGGSGDRYGFALEIEATADSATADSEIADSEIADCEMPILTGGRLPPLRFTGVAEHYPTICRGDRPRSPARFTGAAEHYPAICRGDRPLSPAKQAQYTQRVTGDGRPCGQTMKTSGEPSLCFEELPPGIPAGRTRALLKIQDGCDNYCTYCVIPYARGHARSLLPEHAAGYAKRLSEQGFLEIVITGIEISSYGKDLPGNTSLTDVVREISAGAPRARLRLGSLDPGSVSEKFCDELSNIPNLCDHFHLSLQSGCNETLKRMGRKYDTDTVYEAMSSLRRIFPNCGITADIIVGFPGETDAEFEQTLGFIKSAAFSDMHIFPFSSRPGTRAAEMPEQIAKKIKHERARTVAATAGEMARRFRFDQIGKTVGVLFEHNRDGYWSGHSGNYIEVSVKDGGAKNIMHDVRIVSVEEKLVWGEIVQSPGVCGTHNK